MNQVCERKSKFINLRVQFKFFLLVILTIISNDIGHPELENEGQGANGGNLPNPPPAGGQPQQGNSTVHHCILNFLFHLYTKSFRAAVIL